jgi:hypothetical protein
MNSVLASQPASAAARALRAMMCGTVVLPEDPGYPLACEIWNGAVRRHPALVVSTRYFRRTCRHRRTVSAR